MKSLIVVYSYHHMNTKKVAEVIAEILDAPIKTPQQTDPQEIQQYDLVGFGAGIDSGKHYHSVLNFADKLSQTDKKNVFIFSTAALTGNKKRGKDHSDLREKLKSKGYTVVDEFQCKGFNTNSFMRFFGGMNRGRPNSKDLKDAETFALNLKESLLT
ncbi:flavodoxin [miscellaneous Crenarchaeota group-1 archaeon SG8-32-1]|uniref:Flavodoxin n=1 Tax=miscellaneous Crenarchaeota group-1 archaeon SG8-32-1 TaxID=1685124 RepID=A0A0M0BRT6_9ARCH|nr:MAG: flavodoxin [miscellaneous Crenarchaeota group-1 archaeon SG8-32-1]